MLTKPLSFYNPSTKHVLGFQNPFYLKKARQLEPKLYDGDVIQTNCAIVICDSEETMLLAKESRSKILLKQRDPMVLEKKIPFPSNRPTIVEVLSDLPKVGMDVDQHHLESKTFGFQNEQLLEQVISKDIMNIVVNASVNNASVSMFECKKCLELEKELLNKQDFIEKEKYDKFSVSRERHSHKEAEKRVKSLSGIVDNDKVKKDIDKIETINIKLEHWVSKLVAENKHLKQTYKQLYDLIKPAQQAMTLNPLDNVLAYACMYTKQIQELLVYISDTCPSSPLKSEKLVAVTPMKKARKITFTKTSTTSDNNTQIQVDVHQTRTTNKSLVPSTNEKCVGNKMHKAFPLPVIEFGDSYKVPTTVDPNDTNITSGVDVKSGRTVTITTEDMQRKKNDVKART
nr:hypothetical protein [Tanacetum cinerariifolium]